MTLETILLLDDSRAALESVGGKGASLARLASAGLPVPSGFHVTTSAYRRFVAENNLEPDILAALKHVRVDEPATLEAASDAIRQSFLRAHIPGEIAIAIVSAYAALPDRDPAVAVRSSATAEDLPEASFAGQQETYLNVSGADAVLEAVQKCWASLWTARAIGYRLRQGIGAEGVALAVVVQLLAPAEAAGILFTANPLNGRRDQVVINASWGLGEAVVGGAVTPDTLTVIKSEGSVLERQTALKQVMTGRVDGATEEQPVPESLQRVPVLDDQAAAELTRLAVQIENLYGMPMDIEWARMDGKFTILQARPITALPEPEVEVPDEWPIPNPKSRYMRTSIIDLMPHPLSPLFTTLGMDAIERGIGVMGAELFNMPPDTLIASFHSINGYCYYTVSFSGRQWWLMLSRLVPALPRLLRQGVSYWREGAYPRYKASAKHWSNQPLQTLPPSELLKGIHEVTDAFGYHLASLMVSTMGSSAGSEMLFTQVYKKMAQQAGDPEAPAFLMGFDSLPIQGEKALYDLAGWCREREALAAYLKETPTLKVATQWDHPQAPAGIASDDWNEWRQRFGEHLERYGYSIYDLDFARSLPMDEPIPILEALKLYAAGGGASPYERQRAYQQRRELAEQAVRLHRKGLRRWAFEKSLKWAQMLSPLREEGIAEIGLGYPALRRLLGELGWRLTEAGAIQESGDIYWLEQEEVEALTAALEGNGKLPPKGETVKERKALWRGRMRLTPPSQLPPGKKYMGLDTNAFLASSADNKEGDRIKGVPTSPGLVTATARVLHGPQDFDQMKAGDILVAGITTPAWTPLFALAAGVVTDVGGPLSHGSIVAREYGIPAVMGTGVATRRIRSGQTITVDGEAGMVTLVDE